MEENTDLLNSRKMPDYSGGNLNPVDYFNQNMGRYVYQSRRNSREDNYATHSSYNP